MRTLLAYISYQPIQRLGPVSPHGIGTAAGYLLGVIAMARSGERRGIPKAEVHNACSYAAIGAILGARGFYVLAHRHDFGSIFDVLAVWQGGLTMFGGFAGGLAVGVWYLRRRGLPLAASMDAAAPGFVIGVLVGRLGDLVIADHLGDPTRFALGYRIPETANLAPGYGPPTYVPGAIVHQTALYDLLGLLALAGALALLATRRPRAGTLFGFFAAWYGIQRLLIDFTRNRELIESSFSGLSGSQWAGVAFAAAGLAVIVGAVRRPAPEVVVDLSAPAVDVSAAGQSGGNDEPS